MPMSQRAGIIPAYAGSTLRVRVRGVRGGDHPRVCGEHSMRSARRERTSGSSPRMRGAPFEDTKARFRLGIIPAYAGSTSHIFSPASLCWDHPRVCGEHVQAVDEKGRTVGSSPRMRGARGAKKGVGMAGGIIPAYAGSTARCTPMQFLGKDHPRVCGEHPMLTSPIAQQVGSSPRMRGAQRDGARWVALGGIIPAYAGSTAEWQ